MTPTDIRWMMDLQRDAGHLRLPLPFRIIEKLLEVYEDSCGNSEIDRDIAATNQAPEVVQ